MANFSFSKSPVEPIESEHYKKSSIAKYLELLESKGDSEEAFQDFFERNPAFLPGANTEFNGGNYGHRPHLNVLVTQPDIKGIFTRKPDFLWLSADSMQFSPVFIEIEAPNKLYFTKKGRPTAKFIEAKNQLDEWSTLLSYPENKLSFFHQYNLPEYCRRAPFTPYFILIYGRRSEYINNEFLSRKRSSLMNSAGNQILISFDRLSPNENAFGSICCKIKNGKYVAKYVDSRFVMGPYENDINEIQSLDKAIINSDFLKAGRKEFLLERIAYWLKCINDPIAIEFFENQYKNDNNCQLSE